MHNPPIPNVERTDPQIAGLINDEARRQYEKARLIPSENYVSLAVLEASGSVLTNKYSEGYPGRRYYEGQQLIDPIETIARASSIPGSQSRMILVAMARSCLASVPGMTVPNERWSPPRCPATTRLCSLITEEVRDA